MTYIQDSGKFQNSLFKLVSGATGHASAYVISPATYFVWGRNVLSTKDTLSSREQKAVKVASSIVSDVISLK
jgi:hypothetical protein